MVFQNSQISFLFELSKITVVLKKQRKSEVKVSRAYTNPYGGKRSWHWFCSNFNHSGQARRNCTQQQKKSSNLFYLEIIHSMLGVNMCFKYTLHRGSLCVCFCFKSSASCPHTPSVNRSITHLSCNAGLALYRFADTELWFYRIGWVWGMTAAGFHLVTFL